MGEVEEESSPLRMTTPKVPKLTQATGDLLSKDETPGKIESHRVEALESIHDSLNEELPANVIADETLQECRPSRMKVLAGSTSQALVANDRIEGATVGLRQSA